MTNEQIAEYMGWPQSCSYDDGYLATRVRTLVAAAEAAELIRWKDVSAMAEKLEREAKALADDNESLLSELNAFVNADIEWQDAIAAAVAAERERIIGLLQGIDADFSGPDGWWETSAGVEFGAAVLAKIRDPSTR